MKDYFVYILASRPNGTLYIGVTGNLYRRVQEHKHDRVEGFTKTYQVHRLVYFERFHTIELAIRREKRLKKWNRAWKIRLIEETNPGWEDLFCRYCPHAPRPGETKADPSIKDAEAVKDAGSGKDAGSSKDAGSGKDAGSSKDAGPPPSRG